MTVEGKGGEPDASTNLGRRLLELLRFAGKSKTARPFEPFSLAINSPFRVVTIAAASAICGTGVIAILNAEAKKVADHQYSIGLAIAFVALIIGYRSFQRAMVRSVARAMEDALHEQRVRTCSKLLRLDLSALENFGRTTVIDGVAKQYEALTQALVPLLIGFESAILLLFMTAYLLWQSIWAGALTLIFAAVIIQSYLARSGELRERMQAAAKADHGLSSTAGEVYSGFKELRLDPVKQAAILQDVKIQSLEVADQRASMADLLGDLVTTGNSAGYLLAAAVTFVLPLLSGSDTDLSRTVTTVLFLLGPLGGVVGAAQQLSTARFAIDTISGFEQEVTAKVRAAAELKQLEEPFERLDLINIGFSYPNRNSEPGFAVRDINLTLSKGEVVFITGGNGSGKTTTMRVMTGLYEAQDGLIQVNGKKLLPDEMEAYQSLFSTVFADFHVFRKPYGISENQMGQLEYNLQQFGIRDKLPPDLSLGYDPSALSTGQKKRLALAVALCEDRPIIVLDEWAADQDPYHRELFYKEILPSLRAQGKAVIAVTHDDRYFSLADRRYHLEDSQLRPAT